MMRRKLLTIIFLLVGLQSFAQQGRIQDSWFFRHFRVGMEWGYSQCLFLNRNYNIFSEEATVSTSSTMSCSCAPTAC